MTARPSLDDYVDVAERITLFKERYPDGSLQTVDWGVYEVADRTFIVYQAAAYRTPDDERPGHGTAWEPFPGPTPYTRDSELMNAETAAWGRACVALGIVANRKIASQQEIRARSGESAPIEEPYVADPARRSGTAPDAYEALKNAAHGLKWAAIRECYVVAGLVAPGKAANAFTGLDDEQAIGLRDALLNRRVADVTDVPYPAVEVAGKLAPADGSDLPWEVPAAAPPLPASAAPPAEDLAEEIAREFNGTVEEVLS